jgi:enhancing lycopene biosynthesis protein 2
MKKIAVLLSGCGVFDGSEIYETVLTLMALEKAGAEYQCVAPDMPQYHVINHVTGEPMDDNRNVLIEAARLARGNIKSLADAKAEHFDGLVVPGGFGAAKNLSQFAFKGAETQVQPDVLKFCKGFAEAGKPAGYICIAPTLVNKVYGGDVLVTIGDDADTAKAIQAMGGKTQDCAVSEICIDEQHKVVTTPAYMLANSILEAQSGIEKCVQQVVDWA